MVALPPGARPLPNARPMGKTGGIKNYEKTREDVLGLLMGSAAAEAPPRPVIRDDREALAPLEVLSDDPELGAVLIW